MKGYTGYEKAAFCLLGLYLWGVLFFQGICADAEVSLLFSLILGILSGGIAGTVIWFSRKRWDFSAVQEYSRGGGATAACTMVTFLVYFTYFAAQSPGGISPDVINQYHQGIGETAYNDWHPVLHTLLFFTLPLKFGGGRGLDRIVFLQILYFCLAFGYLLHTLNKNRCPRGVVAFLCVYVWLNPMLATYLAYPWKDIAMTIFGIVLTGQYIQISCSHGMWLGKRWNRIVFAAVAVICTYMRHNAILFTAPMVLLALFCSVRERKVRAQTAVWLAVGMCLVKLLYAGIGVEKPDQRVVETVGLPATIWCNVMQEAPDALPEDTQAILYKIAPPEAYADQYQAGSFNSIKWNEGVNLEALDGLSYAQVAKITYQCFRYAPLPAIEAFGKLTGMVYVLDNRCKYMGVYTGDELRTNTFLQQITHFGFSGIGPIFFGSIGVQMLCMLIAAMAALARGRKSFVHILPLFCYNFGTMLLLSGPDYRFFLVNLPLWIPVTWLVAQDTSQLPIQNSARNASSEKPRRKISGILDTIVKYPK